MRWDNKCKATIKRVGTFWTAFKHTGEPLSHNLKWHSGSVETQLADMMLMMKVVQSHSLRSAKGLCDVENVSKGEVIKAFLVTTE
jgi:hypothetical protein